ncbi:formiminoglutamase [Flavobacterium urocaniciphilum]|uniref:Formiminoglutamase n=2 Tax=Flavobacterium urocaniciphilum TaxID=1299341 RepID=A0A1H9B545_9FLAO|nr:formiminoglutamase [Flavobacterium urocaniciphilum]
MFLENIIFGMLIKQVMEKLKVFNSKDLAKITQHRSGEIKFGEKILTVPANENWKEFITNCNAKFVLIGLPEDIGVKANMGRVGTASAFESALKSLVNFQHNKFCKGNELIALGEIDFSNEMEISKSLNQQDKEDRKKLFSLVENIDKEVSFVISAIVKAGKYPIIVGGGHNNAYGNIKGLALAKGMPVNAINFDAHTDFRIMEGRHSGNGFTYAFEEGFLKRYFIFGLHENFVSKSVFNTLKSIEDRVKYVTYEEIGVRKEKSYTNEITQSLKFISNTPFGLELDLDAIPGIPSSAMTLSGFSVEKARQFVHLAGSENNASYFHICEGAPDLDSSNNNHLTGKLIATLIIDFIKSKKFEEN